ncbi:hypothetical protein [Micromonospora kangleipakensis]|uniref:hypothetical protein n=1 Tax=Micromonospora kangleipakensis TaxID=1077942 RepID=UPI00102A68F4|nr:hypothetical protein [Micromonospora kangleipakensis]
MLVLVLVLVLRHLDDGPQITTEPGRRSLRLACASRPIRFCRDERGHAEISAFPEFARPTKPVGRGRPGE